MQPSSQEIKKLLETVKTIAVVGAKDGTGQAAEYVPKYLMKAGYQIIPIHPVRQNVFGLPTYKSIRDLPGPVDLIDLFRASQYCPDHAREVLAMPWRPLCFWMQLGISSPEARELLEKEGVTVVENLCLGEEHQRLFPSR